MSGGGASGWLHPRRWLLAAAILGAAVIFVRMAQPEKQAAPRFPQPDQTAPVRGNYASDLSALTAQIDAMERTAPQRLNDGLTWEDIARAYHRRSRMTGSIDDLVKAQSAIEKAFTLTTPGAGPHLTQAVIHFSSHRLTGTEAALDAIDRYKAPPPLTEQTDAAALRGDVAFYRGDVAAAKRSYAAAEALLPGEGTAYRRAIIAWRSGDRAEADRQFKLAEGANTVPTSGGQANLLLQRAALALEFGDRETASKLIEAADALYPGDWRIAMRKAQIDALEGRMEQAISAFEGIADRAGNPEPMDIAAGLSRSLGDPVNTRKWADRARAVWTQRIAALPEASWGHALEHELAFGDPKRALIYAARNHRARPFSEALVGLAKAWLANGRMDYALALTARATRQGWNSVELHLVEAEAFALLGKGEEAEAARARAVALNPKALERNPAFVWLSH